MAIDFPNSPSNGALYSAGGKNWYYNGTAWVLQGVVPVIPDGSIVHSQLASDAVTTAKIANSAVTVAKIEANPTFTGTVTLPSTTSIGTVTSTEIGYVDGVTSALQTQLNAKAPLANPTFTGTVSGITSTMVGLGNVNNTADTAKPVSTAQQTALDLKANLASPTFTGTTTTALLSNVYTPSTGDYNILMSPVGTAQGQVSNLAFRATFQGTGDNGVRRSADIWSWFNGGAWTSEALSFGVGTGGTNDSQVRTTELMRIDGSVNFLITGSTATKASGTTWANPSDERLKDNIRDYDKGTAELMQVRVREWEYNGKGGTVEGTKGLGVVADEVVLVLPNTVDTYEAKLESDDEENTDIKRFDATEITWLLVKTVQEQQALIEQLTARLEALES